MIQWGKKKWKTRSQIFRKFKAWLYWLYSRNIICDALQTCNFPGSYTESAFQLGVAGDSDQILWPNSDSVTSYMTFWIRHSFYWKAPQARVPGHACLVYTKLSLCFLFRKQNHFTETYSWLQQAQVSSNQILFLSPSLGLFPFLMIFIGLAFTES